jgi:hypothetical protein
MTISIRDMDCQDWETVKVGRAAKPAKPHPAHIAGAKALRAVEDDDIPKPTKSLSAESRTAIVRLRTALTPPMTQSDLERACSFPKNTIRDIEAGRLCPTPTQLNVLNRVLRTTLKYA